VLYIIPSPKQKPFLQTETHSSASWSLKEYLGICVLILNSPCACWSMDPQIGAAELNNPHSKLGLVQVTTVKILVAQFRQKF